MTFSEQMKEREAKQAREFAEMASASASRGDMTTAYERMYRAYLLTERHMQPV